MKTYYFSFSSVIDQITRSGIVFLTLFLGACHPTPDKTFPSADNASPPPNRVAPSHKITKQKSQSPALLPGNALTRHDFFYSGEQKNWNMYIVRKGRVVWSYGDPTSKGEISDAVLLSTGNILFAHQFGVTELTPDKKVVWNFDAPTNYEIHTAQPIGKSRVLFIESGEFPKLILVNTDSGKTERQWPLPVKSPLHVHGQFRHARLTDAGTLLVAHMDMGKIAEYDVTGKEVWSVNVPSPWSAARLKNGNTLIATNGLLVREVNPNGETVWDLTPADLPEYRVAGFQLATRLPNGNTLINNWVNLWHDQVDPNNAAVQAWEVTPEKKVIWALRSWTPPAALGPATTIQLLDEPNVPEDVHFGDIK